MADVSSVTNHFPTHKEGFVTTLSSTISSGATTVPLTSTSGLTNGDIFVGLVKPGESGEQCFTGTVDTSGSQITGVKWTTGTNADHAAGSTVVDYVTSTSQNMQTKGILVEHNQDGTHGDITATSVTTDTISEETAANGVAIDGMTIKDGKVVGGSAVGVANSSLDTTAGELGGAWQSWTPTWTNVTVGNSTVVAKYTQIGKTIHGKISLDLGSTGSISNSIIFSLPVTHVTKNVSFEPLGQAIALDSGTESLIGTVYLSDESNGFIRWHSDNTVSTNFVKLDSVFPFTETTGDQISLNFTYEAA